MSLENLKKVRLYFPGTLSVILAAVYFFGGEINSIKDLFQNGSAISLTSAIALVTIVLLGFSYNTLRLRDIIWSPLVHAVNANIVTKLFSIAEIQNVRRLSDAQNKEILNSVFYPIVDNDNSLSIKSNIVKENGVMTTCVIDTFILTLIFDIIWIVSSLITHTKVNLLVIVVFIVTIVSILLIYLRYKNHLCLSNEQLGVIRNNYRARCTELITPFQRFLN